MTRRQKSSLFSPFSPVVATNSTVSTRAPRLSATVLNSCRRLRKRRAAFSANSLNSTQSAPTETGDAFSDASLFLRAISRFRPKNREEKTSFFATTTRKSLPRQSVIFLSLLPLQSAFTQDFFVLFVKKRANDEKGTLTKYFSSL